MDSSRKTFQANFKKLVNSEFTIPDYFNGRTSVSVSCPKCGVDWGTTAGKLVTRARTHPHLSTECLKCSHAIARVKAKATIEARYGGHYMHLPEMKAKVAATNQVRYGGKAPSASPEIRAKIRETNLNKTGTLNGQGPEVLAKIRAKSLAERGYDHHTKDPKVKALHRQTMLDRYGVDNPAKHPEFIKRSIKTKGQAMYEEVLPGMIEDLKANPDQMISSKDFQTKHGVNYVTAFRWLRESGHADLIPRGHSSSELETDFRKTLESFYSGPVVYNTRDPLGGLEIDIYFPALKFGIELNGLFWHSEYKKDRNYHLDKHNLATQFGIELWQINQDELGFKSEIIWSMLKVKLGMAVKIPARKTEIRSVGSKEAGAFLDSNHLMGPAPGATALGLYFCDVLVCLATYRKQREGALELVRFASLKNHVVVGGFTKLLAALPKTHTLISFVDQRYATGKSLKAAGFVKESVTLGWKWTDCVFTYNRRKVRANCDGSGRSEKAIAEALGYFKIYDAGQAKWVLRRSP